MDGEQERPEPGDRVMPDDFEIYLIADVLQLVREQTETLQKDVLSPEDASEYRRRAIEIRTLVGELARGGTDLTTWGLSCLEPLSTGCQDRGQARYQD